MHPAAAVVVAVAAVLTAVVTIYRFGLAPVIQLGLEVRELLRDLRGYPGRPGHPPRPGLVEQVGQLDHKLEAHLAWAEEHVGALQAAVQDHLVEAERTRQEGHREASKLWAALEALSGHRDSAYRTRHDDPLDERTDIHADT